MATTFQCSLVTPERQVLDEAVSYASLPAWDGQLGIMHGRAPLLVKLGDGLLRLDPPQGGSRWYVLAGGFAQMRDNRLSLLTTQALGADEVTRPEAEAALREAEARTATGADELNRKQRDTTRARAMLSLLEHAGR